MGLHKITKAIMGLLGVVGLVVAGIVATLDGEGLKSEMKAVGIEALEMPKSIDILVLIAYIVLIISVVLVVLFVLKGLGSGNAKNTLIGLGAFLLVVAISYLLASGDETPLRDGKTLSANGARWVSAGLNAFYILAVLALVSMLGGGLKKLIKG